MRISALLLGFWCCCPLQAHAEPRFARPPADFEDERPPATVVDDPGGSLRRSSAPRESAGGRLSLGPALRVAERDRAGGLFVAMDFGSQSAGLRTAATWVRSGGSRGLSEYAAEIWLDFAGSRELHPIVAAGAALARVGMFDASGGETTATLGVGLLRASLEYALPVSGADARAGVDLIGNMPAVGADRALDVGPWLLADAHIGVGF